MLSAWPLLGQSLRIHLYDQLTQAPISEAVLSLAGHAQRAHSEGSGSYRFDAVRRGRWSLRIEHPAYTETVVDVDLTEDSTQARDLYLTPATYQLPQAVVITAQREAQDPLDQPQHLSQLSAQQLHDLAPRSTPEALMGVTGVWMQKTNHGGGSPFVRGLTGNQTLLLIDGIRLNNSTYRYGPNQYLSTVDPLLLRRVEVLRGSGAVPYGSDALGGVINLLSRSPQLTEAGVRVQGRGYAKAMTHDMEYSARAELELGSPRSALLIGGNYKDFGDLVAGGDSVLAPSAYTQRDFDAKWVQLLGRQGQLTLALQHTDQRNVGRYDQVAQRGYARWQFDPQQRSLAYLRWVQPGQRPWLRKVRLTVSGQRNVEGRLAQRAGSAREELARDEIRTGGLTLAVVSQPQPNWKIVSGLDAYHDWVGSEASERDTRTGETLVQRGLYPDGATAGQASLFTLHTWQRGSWLVNAGARYQWVALQTQDDTFGDQRLRSAALVGNLGLAYRLSDQQRLTASLNSGFRAPNLNDVSSFGAFDFGIEVPTNDLSAERSVTAELGYKARQEALSLSVVGYHTWLFDLITRVPGTFQGDSLYQGQAVYRKANLAQARIMGAEGEAEHLCGDWRFYGGVAYAYGADETGAALRRISPLHGRLGLRYQRGGWWVLAEGLAAARQRRLSGGDIDDHRIPDGGTPGWAVFHVRSGYRWRWLDLTLGLQNLADVRYRYHGSGVDGYGRSAWLALRVTL